MAALGNVLWAAGLLLTAASVGPESAYTTAFLPGWLISGAGVGLALPTILAAATAGLPPARAATGSALASTSRQIGIVLGVAVLVAVFGTPLPSEMRDSFGRSWLVLAAVAGLAALTCIRLDRRSAT